MKIRPVILCGGAGTRLWPDSKNHKAKQFIDFGGWTLLGKTLKRIKSPFFDYPVISTNIKYLKDIKKDFLILKNSNKKDFKIPSNLSVFKKLFSSDNLSRIKCLILPFNAVLKALK